MRLLLPLCWFISISFALSGQTNKDPLSFDDLRQWRKHSVTLSDNGEWYTTLYSLRDKPEEAQDTSELSASAKEIQEYFGAENQTDILYIHQVKEGLKYSIEDGMKPVFSSASDWIAYQITPETKKKKTDNDKKAVAYTHLTQPKITIEKISEVAQRYTTKKQ